LPRTFSIIHQIAPAIVRGEIARLVDILERNDYDAASMDFSDIVAKKLVDDCVSLVTKAGAMIKNHSWEYTVEKGISVRLYLSREVDVSMIKALLGNPSGSHLPRLVSRSVISR
jgi:hypothetical protein